MKTGYDLKLIRQTNILLRNRFLPKYLLEHLNKTETRSLCLMIKELINRVMYCDDT